MIIRDKQDLRKCVKQCVRRAQAIETNASYAMAAGEFGVEANLRHWAPVDESLQESFARACIGSPFAKKPSVLLAALDALQLPVHDLDKAECIAKGYDQETYLCAVLNAMRAKKTVVFAEAEELKSFPLSDERLVPGLKVGMQLFTPGRYGVDYEGAARWIAQWIHDLNVQDLLIEDFSEAAFRYCLIPVCEDERTVLHVHINSRDMLNALFGIIHDHPQVRMIVSAQQELERELIERAAALHHVLVQLRDTENIPYALRVLGVWFIPFASGARLPEEMLGGWVLAKEALWQALYEAYLPLAKAGYELTRERIEADVDRLLCKNYESIHEFEV